MDPQQPLQPYVPPAQPSAGSQPVVQPAFAALPPQSAYTGSNDAFPPAMPVQSSGFPSTFSQTSEPASGGVKLQLVEQLQKANNVLVTVNSNPTVDQLSAAIGLTLILNKLNKHATAVYSGNTPSTIEFLSPEKTLEKNTDSLRDFIIALDKAKADKLRYKVEDKFVKIFITPYHTSLNESDLEFSQGDFNVDVIVTLGVHQREELDQAITAHGRILHDAVTISINNKQTAELGAINWFQADASSLCEMIVSLIEPLQGDKTLLDSQTATAFLTGVVAETERFSNSKTTPHTMNISAILMKAGANQQLIASKLEVPEPTQEVKPFDSKKMDELASEDKPVTPAPSSSNIALPAPALTPTPLPTPVKDGSLDIKHKEDASSPKTKTLSELEKENKSTDPGGDMMDDDLAKIHIDDQGKLLSAEELNKQNETSQVQPEVQPEVPKPQNSDTPAPAPSNMILTPPTLGGDMSSTVKEADAVQPPVEPMAQTGFTEHTKTVSPLSDEEKSQTLEQLEQAVNSKHIVNTQTNDESPQQVTSSAEDVARNAVEQASNSAEPSNYEPIDALNAQPVDLETASAQNSQNSGGDVTNEDVFPPQLIGPDTGPAPDPTAGQSEPGAPPLVPPPLMPPPSA